MKQYTEKEIETINKKLLKFICKEMKNNSTTYDIELYQFAKRIFDNKFIDVCPLDKISNKVGYSIVNLDKTGQPGFHWIAMIKKPNNKVIIYDSLGTLNELNTIKEIQILRPRFIDDDQEQNIKETNCGQRCIAFLCIYDMLGEKNAMLL